MPFGFAQVDEALATVHDIPPPGRSAFANRLKHLQKSNLLPDIRTGRGHAASYSGHHAYLFGVALQFIELGLTPERAVKAVTENLDFIAIPTRWALADLNSKGVDADPHFLRFDPSSLNSLRYSDPEQDDASFGMFYAGVGTLRDLIENMGTLHPRLAVVNLTFLVSDLFSAFSEGSTKDGEQFESELTAWLSMMADDGLETDDGTARPDDVSPPSSKPVKPSRVSLFEKMANISRSDTTNSANDQAPKDLEKRGNS